MKASAPLRLAATLAVLALSAPARPAAAQSDGSTPAAGPETVMGWVREGDAAHTGLKPMDALAAFRHALELDPDAFEALWRASRETVDLGMLAADGDDRKRWYTEAVDYARRARAADPEDARGAEWLAIALGRRALEEGPRSRVRLAVEIRDEALAALELDPFNAGAHHVLGEWNAEIRRLSGIERWFARKLMGGDVFEKASWEDAEFHLRRAMELDPTGLVHYLDLARVYLDRDRDEEARALLREVLERPALEPVDPLNKQAAQDLLRKNGAPDGEGGNGDPGGEPGLV